MLILNTRGTETPWYTGQIPNCTIMWRGQHTECYSKAVHLKGSNKALQHQVTIDARWQRTFLSGAAHTEFCVVIS